MAQEEFRLAQVGIHELLLFTIQNFLSPHTPTPPRTHAHAHTPSLIAGAYGRPGTGRRYVFDVQTPRAAVALKTPLVDGLVEDWEIVEAMLEYSMRERLGAAADGPALAGRPFLLAEHIYASKADREIWCELLFERFGAAGTFMARGGVLALYANGKTSGTAFDMGAGGTQITPVQDGYALMAGARLHPVGGALLDASLAEQLGSAGVRFDPRVPPPTAMGDSGGDGVAAARAGSRQAHPSYNAWMAARTVSELKQRLCRVADAPLEGGGMGETAAPSMPYELPDGTVVNVGLERLAIPELLFDPAPLRARATAFRTDLPGSRPVVALAAAPPDAAAAATASSGRSPYAALLSLQDTLASAVMSCEPDVRRDLVGNIIFTGGASGLPGLLERLTREFVPLAPVGTKPRWLSASREERALGTWLGGSILGSLSGFPELWFSKAEYAEHGAKMVHRKCP